MQLDKWENGDDMSWHIKPIKVHARKCAATLKYEAYWDRGYWSTRHNLGYFDTYQEAKERAIEFMRNYIKDMEASCN